MIHTQKKWILWLSGILLITALIYLGICAIIYDRFSKLPPGHRDSTGNTPSYFTHNPKGYEWFNPTPYFLSSYQTVQFPSKSPGITISGWFIPGKAGHPAIIIVHGYLTSKADTRILVMASLLQKHGFSVLAIDLRDNGASTLEDGRTSLGTKEFMDVLGAKEWLIKNGFPASKIGLAGGSMGAATSLMAFEKDPSIRAVFADSSYASLEKVVAKELKTRHVPTLLAYMAVRLSWLISGDNLLKDSPLQAMKHLNGRSVMIVHSTQDPVTSFWHAQKLIEEAHSNHQVQVQTWIHSLKGHCDAILIDPVTYESKLVTFFENALQ